MELIDLTHKLTDQTPFYPGSPRPEISAIASIDADGFREKLLKITSHT
ncbi:MAG: cyclase family protein, partial [Calditrichaeota bacterium]